MHDRRSTNSYCSVLNLLVRVLKKAGCTDPVFDDAAIEAILNASDGTARVISKLCNASLVIGHSQSANRITADIVMQAINDSTLG